MQRIWWRRHDWCKQDPLKSQDRVRLRRTSTTSDRSLTSAWSCSKGPWELRLRQWASGKRSMSFLGHHLELVPSPPPRVLAKMLLMAATTFSWQLSEAKNRAFLIG